MIQTLLLMAASFVAPPDAWPAFLGQGASTIDPATIPLTWSPTENIAWQSKIPGKGQSSPVIWDQLVFVTSIEGTMKENCHIVCLSLKDGAEQWRQTIDSAQPVRSTYTQSRAAPTPVVDGERVYAFFETGNIIAIDHQGSVQWQRALTEDYGAFESTIGLASSLALVDEVLVVLIDHEGPSYLLGLDVKTGETRWKTERTSRSSYASPGVVPVAGAKQIVCSSSGSIDGYDPKTGEMLWTYEENVGGNRTGAPLAFADGMFAVAASPGMHNEREEQARNTNFIMKVEHIDGQFVPKVIWKTEEAMPSFNSPLVHGGCAYWVSKSGVVYCFDAKTGANLYTKRSGGVCWTTPVGLGERVYLFGKDGLTTVLAVGSEHKVLAENMLWDPDVVGRDARSRDRSEANEHSGHGDSAESKNGATDSAAKPAEATPKTDALAADKKPEGDAESSGRGRRGGRPTGAGRPEATGESADGSPRVDARFADPVQYGVAIVNGSLVVRSGEVVYCVRKLSDKPASN